MIRFVESRFGPYKLIGTGSSSKAQPLERYRPYFENYIVDASILIRKMFL